MRAIVVTEFGGSEVLRAADYEDPRPGPGEVAVDVMASGVNYRDTYERTGAYSRNLPYIPGLEGAGRVSAVGEGVTGTAIGDVVVSAEIDGSYAERAVVRADRAVPVGDADPEQAAAVFLQGLTAHYLTHSTYAIKPGDTALVHAAAGGVGLLLTQMVKLRGGHVIGTVSTEEKEKLARDAGADEVVRYENFAERVRHLTGGVHVVYDGVGKTTFDDSMSVLRPRGMLALYGASSGPVPPVDPQRLNAAGSLFLTRPTLAHYTATREELTLRAQDLFGWIAAGDLSVHVGGRYPLEDARRAHDDLESRRTTGKLLLIP
ncbi:quinone oxidoreductase [Actinoallomurus oryzae]|uniref:Quinone oxidoreductase n=1 Tax=Actinoallomurus oryzae TaxID=502180 RepID=A0ABP8QU62_9ACTN